MSYEVIFDPGAVREFKKIPNTQRQHLADIIDGLTEDPRPPGAEKLTNVEAYKICVGDYRIIYTIKDDKLIVLIVKVGNRRDVYKDIDIIRKRLKK